MNAVLFFYLLLLSMCFGLLGVVSEYIVPHTVEEVLYIIYALPMYLFLCVWFKDELFN